METLPQTRKAPPNRASNSTSTLLEHGPSDSRSPQAQPPASALTTSPYGKSQEPTSTLTPSNQPQLQATYQLQLALQVSTTWRLALRSQPSTQKSGIQLLWTSTSLTMSARQVSTSIELKARVMRARVMPTRKGPPLWQGNVTVLISTSGMVGFWNVRLVRLMGVQLCTIETVAHKGLNILVRDLIIDRERSRLIRMINKTIIRQSRMIIKLPIQTWEGVITEDMKNLNLMSNRISKTKGSLIKDLKTPTNSKETTLKVKEVNPVREINKATIKTTKIPVEVPTHPTTNGVHHQTTNPESWESRTDQAT